jgi:multicomponent Na+:H+ antiporter subunit C
MMETVFSLLVGLFFAAGIYLMLSKAIVRILLGIVLFGNAVNLLIFTAGRITREVPPVMSPDMAFLEAGTANPLPQALILTAIVISFCFFSFLLVLAFRTYQEVGTDDTVKLRVAEPEGKVLPPMGY